jgi:hypothetical protein
MISPSGRFPYLYITTGFTGCQVEFVSFNNKN